VSAKFVTNGLKSDLQDYVTWLLANGALIRLYQNNYTPVFASLQANFTTATFSGYADVLLAQTTPIFDDGAERWRQNWTRATFTHNGGGVGQLIYGYYVYVPGSEAQWAERFPAPISMTVAGNSIPLDLFTTCKSEF
jgi:hypothetical protein